MLDIDSEVDNLDGKVDNLDGKVDNLDGKVDNFHGGSGPAIASEELGHWPQWRF